MIASTMVAPTAQLCVVLDLHSGGTRHWASLGCTAPLLNTHTEIQPRDFQRMLSIEFAFLLR